ncbi:hypothetical protein BB560_001113 [Smittium megazygosporum]|uniref:Large ribosomal subunit protein mL44 n=1 Tax=Smittium megazygosporum TaxID=133381 RepID=A0A2T9ZIE6_9FUNG|nr:hypothetical protein BB560_001113 [Smittium megazygosporum]
MLPVRPFSRQACAMYLKCYSTRAKKSKRVINLYTSEYLDARYSNMPAQFLQSLQQQYFGIPALAEFGKLFGLQFLVRWDSPQDLKELRVGETKILGKAVQALVGAIFKDQGSQAAKDFIHTHFFSQKIDPTSVIEFPNPIQHLHSLCIRKKIDRPIARLLKETGRLTNSPVFIVGMFSGVHKIGEGFGSSLKMAEFRAAKDALIKFYSKEEKSFVLPSITEGEGFSGEFIPNPLKDTPPIA